jgi:hypothetical protein
MVDRRLLLLHFCYLIMYVLTLPIHQIRTTHFIHTRIHHHENACSKTDCNLEVEIISRINSLMEELAQRRIQDWKHSTKVVLRRSRNLSSEVNSNSAVEGPNLQIQLFINTPPPPHPPPPLGHEFTFGK